MGDISRPEPFSFKILLVFKAKWLFPQCVSSTPDKKLLERTLSTSLSSWGLNKRILSGQNHFCDPEKTRLVHYVFTAFRSRPICTVETHKISLAVSLKHKCLMDAAGVSYFYVKIKLQGHQQSSCYL